LRCASSVNIETSDLLFSVQIGSIVAVHRMATTLVRRKRQGLKLRVLRPGDSGKISQGRHGGLSHLGARSLRCAPYGSFSASPSNLVSPWSAEPDAKSAFHSAGLPQSSVLLIQPSFPLRPPIRNPDPLFILGAIVILISAGNPYLASDTFTIFVNFAFRLKPDDNSQLTYD
jgi:hypothetical protein